ncbi:MAG: hypothetical protein HC893_02950 [Chloroflexaceae bacterium]|nr:hypothetical protein [Chloroflexaceae bacterium]NJL32987.1 hypothetical protein [Chloroflexaceae bacterium]NJO05091.1 hypothetical protein [Chloroflexaceae bacterium]
MSAEIYYGKGHVTMYRTYATPLDGVLPIPESTFTGRTNTLFAADIDVQVFGNNFLPAYTEGDNSMVVATDTMKNFILRESLQYRAQHSKDCSKCWGSASSAPTPRWNGYA